MPNVKSLRWLFPTWQEHVKGDIKIYSIESRFVTGPSNILSAGVYVCTFPPGNFTGWGSEGVNVSRLIFPMCCHRLGSIKSGVSGGAFSWWHSHTLHLFIDLLVVPRWVSRAHIPSIAFRHLPPNSARFSYATEGALFISAQLSTDVVSALWKVQVLIRLWKQPSAQART